MKSKVITQGYSTASLCKTNLNTSIIQYVHVSRRPHNMHITCAWNWEPWRTERELLYIYLIGDIIIHLVFLAFPCTNYIYDWINLENINPKIDHSPKPPTSTDVTVVQYFLILEHFKKYVNSITILFRRWNSSSYTGSIYVSLH